MSQLTTFCRLNGENFPIKGLAGYTMPSEPSTIRFLTDNVGLSSSLYYVTVSSSFGFWLVVQRCALWLV